MQVLAETNAHCYRGDAGCVFHLAGKKEKDTNVRAAQTYISEARLTEWRLGGHMGTHLCLQAFGPTWVTLCSADWKGPPALWTINRAARHGLTTCHGPGSVRRPSGMGEACGRVKASLHLPGLQ